MDQPDAPGLLGRSRFQLNKPPDGAWAARLNRSRPIPERVIKFSEGDDFRHRLRKFQMGIRASADGV
jgi:hypothetical protein